MTTATTPTTELDGDKDETQPGSTAGCVPWPVFDRLPPLPPLTFDYDAAMAEILSGLGVPAAVFAPKGV